MLSELSREREKENQSLVFKRIYDLFYRDCDQTPYKCCPDGITPAKGEDSAGCDDIAELVGGEGESIGCDFSEFRCCPDDVNAATGPNYEGCDIDPIEGIISL